MAVTEATTRKRIDPSIPAYRRIESDLRRRINAGDWQVGGMLPSRRDLSKEYGVDAVTLSRGIAPLLDDGTLRAENGRGTFVARSASPLTPETTHETNFVFRPRQTAPLRRAPNVTATVCIVAGVPDGMIEWVGPEKFWNSIIVHGVEQAFLGHADVTLRFENTYKPHAESPMPLNHVLANVRSNEIDAIVYVLPDDDSEVEQMWSFAETKGIPVIAIVEHTLSINVPHVFHDMRAAGYEAATHLIHRGYREIAYFAPFQGNWVTERRIGVEQVIERSGSNQSFIEPVECQYLTDLEKTDQRDVAYQAARLALSAGWQPNGVIAANDNIAHGFIKAAAEHGLIQGRNYGLVGFDNLIESRSAGLTTMHPPLDALGREAGRMVMQKLSGLPTPTQIGLQAHLIPRESSRRLSRH